MNSLPDLYAALHRRGVRFVLIGLGGANLYARSGSGVVITRDRDLFLPPDAANAIAAWEAAEEVGLELWRAGEPLGKPLDDVLASAVVERRALVKALGIDGIEIDFTMVMAGFAFEEAWAEHREFHIEGVPVPVARLTHIVRSKATADRPKDRAYLATLGEELRDLMDGDWPAGYPRRPDGT